MTRLLAIFMTLFFFQNIQAAFFIKGHAKELSGDKETTDILIWISATGVRSEVTLAKKPMVLLYRTDKNKSWIVSPSEKTYFDVEEFKEQMLTVMAILPEEQRKAVEKQLGLATPEDMPQLKFVPTKATAKVGSWQTKKWDGFEDGQKRHEIFELTEQNPLTPQEQTSIKGMEKLGRSIAGPSANFLPPWSSFKSLVVTATTLERNTAKGEFVVTAFGHKDYSENHFTVPANFKKQGALDALKKVMEAK